MYRASLCCWHYCCDTLRQLFFIGYMVCISGHSSACRSQNLKISILWSQVYPLKLKGNCCSVHWFQMYTWSYVASYKSIKLKCRRCQMSSLNFLFLELDPCVHQCASHTIHSYRATASCLTKQPEAAKWDTSTSALSALTIRQRTPWRSQLLLTRSGL